MAEVVLQHPGHVHAVGDHRLVCLALNVDHPVHRPCPGAGGGQGALPGGQNAVAPGWGHVHATGPVAPGAAHSLGQLVHVKLCLPPAVFGQLQLVQAQGQVVQERRCLFVAHHRCVECLDVGPHRRVSPHGSRQHQSHRLAGSGVHPPQVHEKGERSQHLQQRRGKGGRQDHPGRGGHAPALSGNRQPFLEAALLPHRVEQLPEACVPVEDQPLHIGGEALSWYVPQPPDAFPLGQPVIVPVFQVGNVLHKPLGRLAGDGDPPVCQGGHLLGGGQHGFLHNDLPPVPPLPVGQPELLHSRVDVD